MVRGTEVHYDTITVDGLAEKAQELKSRKYRNSLYL